MLILADENIPAARNAFGALGEVRLFAGRGLRASDVAGADALLVRSVTAVNAALLAGSRVRFVGSATIGTDHVDLGHLAQAGISFAHAPGSNADSAAQYVLASLLTVLPAHGRRLAGLRAGIVGHGNVGSRVRQLLTTLGARCVVNDPPLQEQGRLADGQPLGALPDCDVVTLHVPLEHGGRHPTAGLIGADFLEALRPGAVLINTARGPVVDEEALLRVRARRPDLTLIWDCWQHEPRINGALLAQARIATPHIAGYSLDGKLRATGMLHRALCAHLGRPPCWHEDDALAGAATPHCGALDNADGESAVARAVLACYQPDADDARLRACAAQPAAAFGACFDALRRDYPVRREFAALRFAAPPPAALAPTLGALGFRWA